MSATLSTVPAVTSGDEVKRTSEGDSLNNAKVLHIPQGFSGRITQDSIHYGIEGLYTDSFGICNILVCLSKDKTKGLLCHIDTHAINCWEKVRAEIEWVGDDQELFILHRTHKEVIKNALLKKVRTKLNVRVKMHTVAIAEEFDGILCTLKRNENSTIHPHIKALLIDVVPPNLHRHPQEQRVLAVQKIEQIIGQLELALTKRLRDKQFSIFDGRGWESLEEETRLQKMSEQTKAEMDFFQRDDLYVKIASKLLGVMRHTRENNPISASDEQNADILNGSALDVAFFMESYLNDYTNIQAIFYRNVQDIFNNKATPPITAQDKQIILEVGNLKDPKTFYEVVTRLVEKFNAEAPESAFKEGILPEFKKISMHYINRLNYAKLDQEHQTQIQRAQKLNSEALACYKAKPPNYERAAALFSQAICNLTFSTVKTDAQLASLYYNYGKTLLKLQDYTKAYHCLQYSLLLRQQNKLVKPDKADIEKIEAALLECKQAAEQHYKDVEGVLFQFGLNTTEGRSTKSPSDHIVEYCNDGLECLKNAPGRVGM